ncbi:DUF2768 domain-containing protein [Lysinibacillus sp. S2017]|uniref:DUF2768 domain-containing protein n=1 Tax=Lysinibacillus sp. S2017 TaxID=2561923 RepID=UPI001F0DA512|nr:DUF2768 domain-containing protein [Lysinibacillus sp. S2017]
MQHFMQATNPASYMVLASNRGPLASLHALDVMWVSFYSIGLLFASLILISAIRKWIHNAVLAFILRLIAYGIFLIGTFLMVLVILTWPN